MEIAAKSSVLLADWIAGFDADNCSVHDLNAVRLRILDYISSAAAGWTCNRTYNEAVDVLFCADGCDARSSVLFNGKKLPASAAAYVNATYGHGADMDDGHRQANGHPGVALIPAVLALAQAENSAPVDIFAAILVGYETYVRVSMAVQPGLLHRGFHGTGAVGAIAASAACAKLLRLDAEGIHNAISLGAVQASGLFEVSESGQSVKPINPANACRTGVESALLARAGVQAPENPFEGAKGFFHAFTDEAKPECLVRPENMPLAIHECYFKLSSACRHTHPSIDAGVALGRRTKIEPEKISQIDIYTYPNAAFVTGKIALPKNSAEAKFSMRYALAMALQRGHYSFQELEDARCISDQTRSLVGKMHVIPEEKYECAQQGIRGGRVVIHFADGSEDGFDVRVPRGDPENPLTQEELLDKMNTCCCGVFDKEQQKKIYTCIMKEPFDLSELMQLSGAACAVH